MKRFISLLVCLFFTLTLGAWSKDGTPAWRLIKNPPASPHRTFANPKAGKIPVALMLLSGIGQREAIELQQRFEYRYILLPVYDYKTFSPFAGYSTSGKNIRIQSFNRNLLLILIRFIEIFNHGMNGFLG